MCFEESYFVGTTCMKECVLLLLSTMEQKGWPDEKVLTMLSPQ